MNTRKNTNWRLLISIALFLLFIGLAAGNFAYQIFTDQDWETAKERSFFQATALLAVWITCLINQSNKD